MSTNTSRPKWWQVYLTLPLLIALFIVDSRLKLSERGHQAVQIGIILLVYGLVHLWLKANAAALSNMDRQKFHGTVIVTRIPLQQLSKPKYDKHPMFQLPDHEIKNILSDTFKMDYIDAEFLPVDEVPQELNKE
jgi:hypothetical protein